MVSVLILALLASAVSGFAPQRPGSRNISSVKLHSMAAPLVEPTKRDDQYGTNVARYLVDLHDAKATFDFCGGMMFQLVLSDKLRDHLAAVASEEKEEKQPVIYDASKARMFQTPDYDQSATADNVRYFHGREIRKVPHAAGGMGFVLQLSMAGDDDPQGWTPNEVAEYDGWGHDAGRTWRKGERLETEGYDTFRKEFGPDSFGLHHRFYLHFDRNNRMWLSAEDGCEGTPSDRAQNPLSKLLRLGR